MTTASVAVKERPILFSGPMVRAILEGRKTETRRPIKQPHEIKSLDVDWARLRWHATEPYKVHVPVKHPEEPGFAEDNRWWRIYCPYGQVGDRLWVRETFVLENTDEYHEEELRPTDRPYKLCGDDFQGHYFLIPHYRATEPEPHLVPLERSDPYDDTTVWRPSIHMPRWASRIDLETTGIRAERVQDITPWGAVAEGCPFHMDDEDGSQVTEWFADLWDSIYGKGAWERNDWVWVIQSKREEAAQPTEPD